MQAALHLQLLLVGAVSAADVAMARTIGDVMNEVRRTASYDSSCQYSVLKLMEFACANSNYVDHQVIEI